MTQGQMIIEYLKTHRTITPMQAFWDLGITKLATRIGELIRAGYKIKKGWADVKNRSGETVKVRCYSLEA